MYSNILLTHKIVVTLFLVQYLIKLFLLLTDKKELLLNYSKMTRIPEMLVALTFLLTGIWMLTLPGVSVHGLFILKLICVFAAIPLAVIGFRRYNKALASLSIILIIAAYGLAEMNKKEQAGGPVDTSSVANDPIASGKLVYQGSCINCHGADGKLGGSGAKDLSMTVLSIDQQKDIIRNGKSAMPGNKDLTDAQVSDVIQYIGTLRH